MQFQVYLRHRALTVGAIFDLSEVTALEHSDFQEAKKSGSIVRGFGISTFNSRLLGIYVSQWEEQFVRNRESETCAPPLTGKRPMLEPDDGESCTLAKTKQATRGEWQAS